MRLWPCSWRPRVLPFYDRTRLPKVPVFWVCSMTWHTATAPTTPEDLSQWFTPRDLATDLVEWAGIKDTPQVTGPPFVLEPSAGDGAFVEPLLLAGCRVVANDIDPKMVARMTERFGNHPGLITLEVSDFIDLGSNVGRAPPQFDWVVLNPPYENGQDTAHIALACEIGQRVLALVRTPALHGVERYERIWSRYPVAKVAILPARPSFFLAGKATGGPRHDFCAVVIDKGHVGPARVDWLAP